MLLPRDFQDELLQTQVTTLHEPLPSPLSVEEVTVQGLMDTNLVHAEQLRRVDPQQARELAKAAEEVARIGGDKRALADSLRIQSECNLYLDLHQVAQPQAAEALALYTEIDDQAGQAAAMATLGITYQRGGDYARALELLSRSLEMSGTSGFAETEGDCWNAIGMIHLRSGQQEEAIRALRRSLEIRGEIHDPYVAYTMHNIAVVYEEMRDYARALEMHLSNLTYFEQQGNNRVLGFTLSSLGNVYHHLADAEQSRTFHERSGEVWEAQGNQYRIGNTLSNIGIVYHLQGDYAHAIDSFERALQIARSIQHWQLEQAVLANLGALFYDSGRYAEAQETLTQLLQSEQALIPHYACEAHLTLGRVLGTPAFDGYNLARAQDELNQSLALATELQVKPFMAKAYLALSEVQEDAGNLAEALRCYREYHRLDKEAFNEDSERRVRSLQTVYTVEQERRNL